MPRLGVLEHGSQGTAGSALRDPGGVLGWGAESLNSHPVSEPEDEQTGATALPLASPQTLWCLVYRPPSLPQLLGSSYSKVRGQEAAPCAAPAFINGVSWLLIFSCFFHVGSAE